MSYTALVQVVSDCALICISLMIDDVVHFLIYLLAIYLCSFEKYLFHICSFFHWVVCFLNIVLFVFLILLKLSFLPNVWFWKYSLTLISLLLHPNDYFPGYAEDFFIPYDPVCLFLHLLTCVWIHSQKIIFQNNVMNIDIYYFSLNLLT